MKTYTIEVNDGDEFGVFDNVIATNEEEAIEIAYSGCHSEEVEILSVWEVEEEAE